MSKARQSSQFGRVSGPSVEEKKRHAQGREMLAINSLRAVCGLSPQLNCISLHCSVSRGAWSFIFVFSPPQCQSCSSPPYERGRGKHNKEQVACIKLSPRVCTSFFSFPASSRGNKTFCSYWIVLLHFPFFFVGGERQSKIVLQHLRRTDRDNLLLLSASTQPL